MTSWTDLFNVVLAGVALGCLLWAFRQRSLLRRVESGMISLRSGQTDVRLRRGPEDSEAVINVFDALADHLESTRPRPEGPSDAANIVTSLCAALRPPLSVIQGHTRDLLQQSAESYTPSQRESLQRLQTQVDRLLQLLESPADLSDLRRDYSGLQRQILQLPQQAGAATVLLVDDEGPTSQIVSAYLADRGSRAFVASGADAATIMVRALRPSAILVNVRYAEGIGWKILGRRVLNTAERITPVWLYVVDPDEKRGCLWTPASIWIWPIDIKNDPSFMRWQQQSFRYRFHLLGEDGLIEDVRDVLVDHGLEADTTIVNPDALVLEGCCTILVEEQNASKPAIQFILVVREQICNDHPNDLANACARSAAASETSLEELLERLSNELERHDDLPCEFADDDSSDEIGKGGKENDDE